MSRPNLFEYATSELSQDAFLCWLIAWARYDDDDSLHRCSLDFISSLYAEWAHETSEESRDIELLHKPIRQYLNIDIYFITRISGKVVSFIIEDKTGTSHHSNQLKNYPERIARNKIPDEEIVCVYLKTGYWFPEDYLAKNFLADYPYVLVSGEKLHAFLQEYVDSTSNNILQDYFIELGKKLAKIPRFSLDCDPVRDFDHEQNSGAAVVQCKFTIELSKKIMGLGGEYVSDGDAAHRVRHGHSMGGAPWTQLDVFRQPLIEGGKILEAVFYRLDFRVDNRQGEKRVGRERKRLPSISLRQWAPLNGKQATINAKKLDFTDEDLSNIRTRKLSRLERFKSVVRDLMRKYEKSGLKFGLPRNDNFGANESDIAVLFMESSKDVAIVLEKLPQFHAEFVEACKGKGLIEHELTCEQ